MYLYAIVKTGGREYRVSPGKTVKFERLDAELGEIIDFGEVSTLVNGDQTVIGQPIIEGVRVRAQVVKHGQEKGVIVFRMKRRRLYQKKNDRPRQFTLLKIDEITFGDDVFTKKDLDPRKLKKAIAAAKVIEEKKAKEISALKPEKKIQNTAPAKTAAKTPIRPPVKAEKISLTDRPPARTVELPRYDPETKPSSQNAAEAGQPINDEPNKRLWIAIVIALLILLALLTVFWNKESSQQTKVETEKTKEKPPVDIRLLETGQADEPSSPAQPPD